MDNKIPQIDYSKYGVFNGKPYMPFYNRERRRKYIRKYKHARWYCPFDNCNVQEVIDDEMNVCCTLCGRIIGYLKKVGEINDNNN